MKTKESLLERMRLLGVDRHWLADLSNYSYDTVRNKLGEKAVPSGRMLDAFDRVISEEEERRGLTRSKNIYEKLTFTKEEKRLIEDAMEICEISDEATYLRHAIIAYSDQLTDDGRFQTARSPEEVEQLETISRNRAERSLGEVAADRFNKEDTETGDSSAAS